MNSRSRAIAVVAGLCLLLDVGIAASINSVAAGSGSSDQVEEDENAAGPQFVLIDGLNVPIIRKNRVERHIFLSIALEVPDGAARREVWLALPRLRDAFVRELHVYLHLVPFERNPSFLNRVKARLLRVSERVMGAGVVKAVLIQKASERRFI